MSPFKEIKRGPSGEEVVRELRPGENILSEDPQILLDVDPNNDRQGELKFPDCKPEIFIQDEEGREEVLYPTTPINGEEGKKTRISLPSGEEITLAWEEDVEEIDPEIQERFLASFSELFQRSEKPEEAAERLIDWAEEIREDGEGQWVVVIPQKHGLKTCLFLSPMKKTLSVIAGKWVRREQDDLDVAGAYFGQISGFERVKIRKGEGRETESIQLTDMRNRSSIRIHRSGAFSVSRLDKKR